MLKKIGRSFKAVQKNMGIRKTVILGMIAIFFMLSGLFYFFAAGVLQAELLKREQDAMTELTSNAGGVVCLSYTDMTEITKAWAQSGVFNAKNRAEDAELHAIEREITRLYDLDLIIATDRAGKVTHQSARETALWQSDVLRQLSTAVETIALRDKANFSSDGLAPMSVSAASGMTGFVCLGEQVYFLSSSPVIDTVSAGYDGNLILGASVSGDRLRQPAYESDYLFKLEGSRTAESDKAIQADGTVTAIDYKTQSSTAHVLIKDIFNEPSILMTVVKQYDFSNEIGQAAASLLGWFSGLLLIFMLIAYSFIEKMLLRPITLFGDSIERADERALPVWSREFKKLAFSVSGLLKKTAERENEARSARRSLRVFSQIVNAASDEMILFNAEGKIEFINPSVSKNMGYGPEELIGAAVTVIVTPQQKEFLNKVMVLVQEKSAWHGELIFKNQDGECLVSKASISPVASEDGVFNRFILVKRSLDDVKSYKKQINHIEHHDLLTGLPNRTYFYKKITEAFEEAAIHKTKVAIFYIDIDRFKYINDTFGHGIGDKLINLIAMRFIEHFSNRFFVARMGGDEFAMIHMGITDVAEVEKAANRVLLMLSRPFIVEGEECILSASIGSSVYPDNSKEIEEIIKNADEAMYHAKQLGRNQYCAFSEEMHDIIIQRVSMENNLRMAVANGCTDFVPYFQPKVDSKTKQIVGSEALIRWMTPGGIINPNDFIPIAEETGLICPISRYMLIEVCKYNRRLYDLGIDISVSINISSRVILDENFVSMVEDAVQISRIKPEKLDIEITEGTLMEDVDRVNAVLEKIKDMGVTITVDDFGTGYSSLSYLKKFYVNRLKIDRAFITGLPDSRDDMALVNAILAMAKSLNILVTAEGVETEMQFEHLTDLNCEEIQGFYISEPMPFDSFCSFFETWEK